MGFWVRILTLPISRLLSRGPLPFIYIAASTPPLLNSLSRLILTFYIPPFPMLATARIHDLTMRDLEQELRDTLARRHGSDGEPLEGLHVLTRRMENEDEEQFDVDLTILDFLVYKATGLVFEWRSSADPFHSDLPNALVTMTGGRYCLYIRLKVANSGQIGEPFFHTSIMAAD